VRTLQDHLFGPGPKRILSLDGGGVRGLITLGLLQRAEDILKGRSPDPEAFRLADYFDLIGGTSTGGIIATLLALHYRVADIHAIYLDLCPRVFQRMNFLRKARTVWGLRAPMYGPGALQACVDEVIEDYLGKDGGPPPTLGSPHLKTGLGIVMKRIDTNSVWVLTNNPRMKWWHPDSPHWNHKLDRASDRFVPNCDYTLNFLACATASAPFYLGENVLGVSPNEVGVFLDGGASPFNNPALELFLMATLKNYRDDGTLDPERPFSPFGFDWQTGENKLLLYSVGTGTYRLRFAGDVFVKQLNMLRARDALRGMIDDGMKSALIWCQALSAPADPFLVDGNLEDMRGLRITPDRLMTFKRVDPLLERLWSRRELGIDLLGRKLHGVRAFDNAHPRNLALLQAIGAAAAGRLVAETDFPAVFDPVYAGGA
jgi:uncharacterized protein